MTDRRDDELRRRLTPIQYEVTRHNATEPPFANPYWDNDEEGLYVDVVTGEPLFSSRHQFDAGCGWPSFDRTLAGAPVTEHRDTSIPYMPRTEIRGNGGHLGHVFTDGPTETGRRYCINSAALRFIPAKDLVREGYGDYVMHDADRHEVGAEMQDGEEN